MGVERERRANRELSRGDERQTGIDYRFEFENLVIELSGTFTALGPDEVDDGITEALVRIGTFVGADYSLVYSVSEDGKFFRLTHQWHREYAVALDMDFEDIPLLSYPWAMESLNRGETIHLRDPLELPEEARKALAASGITSLFVTPIVFSGVLTGVIALITHQAGARQEKDRTEALKGLMKIVAGIFAHATARKKTEEAFLDQIRFQQTLIDAIPNPIYYKDVKGHYVACNRSFTQYLGLQVGQIIGKTDYDIAQKYLADIYAESDRKLLESSTTQRHESFISCADGTLKDVIFYKAPLHDKNGLASGIVGTMLDITEQKWVEKKLKEAHERFITVLDSLDVGVYVVDMDTLEILFANKKIQDRCGAMAGAICWDAIFPNQTGPCEFCPNPRLLNEKGEPGEVYLWEMEDKQTGKWWLLNDRAIRWVDGRLAKMQISTEITRIKQMEAALRESEELFKTLAENSFTGVGLYNEKFLYVNPEMVKILGLPENELLNIDLLHAHFLDIYATELKDDRYNIFVKTLSGERLVNISDSTKIALRNGVEKWIRIYAASVEYQGKPTGLINIIDVTQQMKYEQQLQEKQRELEELNRDLEKKIKEAVDKSRQQEQLLIQQSKMAAMGEMIASIAHQWRQPLNTLGLIIQDVQDAHEYGELDAAYIDRTVKESMGQIHFMSKTIDDFRNFFVPTKEKRLFNVIQSFYEVVSIVSAQLKSSYIRIIAKFTKDDAVTALGYPNEFKQVLLNIVSNARDAIVDKRRKGLMKNEEEGILTIAMEELPDAVLMHITDNGGGIPEDIIAHVFDAYFTTKKHHGSGIGLYMSKVIIENNMGGRLSVQNVDRGARFTIELLAHE